MIRTRDRPIIDVPYRCVALGITSTKTVPSRISTPPSTFAARSFLFLSFPSCSCFPADRRATLLVSYELFSPFHRGRTFRGKTSIKPVPLERYEALVFRLFRRRLVLLFPLPPLPISLYFPFDPSLSNAPRARQLVGSPVYV